VSTNSARPMPGTGHSETFISTQDGTRIAVACTCPADADHPFQRTDIAW
jgi:hypothetical protein